jgi:two-component system chemotaxis response regulator CheB
MDKLKVLVVDDSVLYRKILSDLLKEFPQVEVIGSAHHGKAALEKIARLKPDFITLDFEMPEFDGIETLRRLKRDFPEVKAIMVSAHTQKGAEITMRALSEGAFDFISKPEGVSPIQSIDMLRNQLDEIIKGLTPRLIHKKSLVSRQKEVEDIGQKNRSRFGYDSGSAISRLKQSSFSGKCEIVAVGISTGGPNALAQLVPQLPKDLKVPVVIVQHMPPVFTEALAKSLDKKSGIKVVEAADGMLLEPGCVFIAPGGRQMKVEKESGIARVKITDDDPENNCKPAVDYLFRSVASCYRGNSLGVIMTGMGSDGTKGLMILKKFGAKVIAQDEASCVVFGMPMEAIKAGVVDKVKALDDIAGEIVASLN